MALLDICGINFFSNFKSPENDGLNTDVVNVNGSLGNPCQLALPPLGCVSLLYFLFDCFLRLDKKFYVNIFICVQPRNALSMPVDDHGREIKMNYDHGTTTLGFKYQGGIVLAVDSRATGGQFIGNNGLSLNI